MHQCGCFFPACKQEVSFDSHQFYNLSVDLSSQGPVSVWADTPQWYYMERHRPKHWGAAWSTNASACPPVQVGGLLHCSPGSPSSMSAAQLPSPFIWEPGRAPAPPDSAGGLSPPRCGPSEAATAASSAPPSPGRQLPLAAGRRHR